MRKIWNSEKLYDMKFSFDEKCRSLFNITKEYFKTKKKNPIMFVGGGLLLLIIIVGISFSYANLTPVDSIEIYSENANFENGDMGSWGLLKSIEWTENATANLNFIIQSNPAIATTRGDFIFVVDNSASMTEERFTMLKQVLAGLIYDLILTTDENNKAALVSFNSTATILSDFTRDVNTLLPSVMNMTAEGETNYYDALLKVDEILNNYESEDGTLCNIILITDGYPNTDTPKEVEYAKTLREKYPYIMINSIAYEIGSNFSGSSLNSISDNVFFSSANQEELLNQILLSSGFVQKYDSFVIEDTINSEYFDIVKTETDFGKVKIDHTQDNSKIIWDLENKYFSFDYKELNVKIKIKDKYINKGGIYQTNIQTKITSSINGIDENVISSLTPIIADNYVVTYDGNDPEDCTVEGVPNQEYRSVYTIAPISDTTPTCSGYMFKGWKIESSDIEKIGDNSFKMPEEHVTIKAEWSKLSVKKTMSGKISPAGSLYNIMANNAVPDNRKSQFVTNPTGIDFDDVSSDTNGKGIYQMASTANDEYPIYYYRGAVENNNLKFADFCWKIVRTTDTGGVKLIYNGLPDANGTCTTTTGAETTIGISKFNSPTNSLADVGYMYGTRYESNYLEMRPSFWDTWDSDVKQIHFTDLYQMNYYSNNVNYEYDEVTGKYIYSLVEPFQFQYLPSVNKEEKYRIEGKYTCGIGKTTCESVYYIQALSTNSYLGDNIYLLNNGKTYDNIVNTNWVYGNDVEYKDIDSDGINEYVLVDTYESAPIKYSDAYETISSKYHYTCLGNTNNCKEIHYAYYINNDVRPVIYYITLTNGKKIDDALKEMIVESTNDNDSTIKKYIDDWYSQNMINYTNKLEDTIWCNNRNIIEYGGWNKDISATEFLNFGNTTRPSFTCNLNDSFTVDELYKEGKKVGNGRLTYPVALLIEDEFILAGVGKDSSASKANYYLNNGVFSYIMDSYFNYNYSRPGAECSGWIGYPITGNIYVRPAISLNAEAKVISGSGFANDPYVLK